MDDPASATFTRGRGSRHVPTEKFEFLDRNGYANNRFPDTLLGNVRIDSVAVHPFADNLVDPPPIPDRITDELVDVANRAFLNTELLVELRRFLVSTARLEQIGMSVGQHLNVLGAEGLVHTSYFNSSFVIDVLAQHIRNSPNDEDRTRSQCDEWLQDYYVRTKQTTPKTHCLQGRWKMVSLSADRESNCLCDMRQSDIFFVVTGVEFKVLVGNEVHEKGVISVDVDSVPWQLDQHVRVGPDEGGTHLGLFRIEDRQLIHCQGGVNLARPDAFESDGTSSLAVFRRVY